MVTSDRQNNMTLPATILPSNLAWLAIATGAAAVNNAGMLQTAIGEALEHGVAASELYEAFLQLYLFAGFPAALEAQAALYAVLHARGIPASSAACEPYDVALFTQRGEDLCRRIYTTAYDRMRERVGTLSPEMDTWMIVEGYGKTLSRPGLSPRVRELVTVAVLGLLGWRNQLYSHLRGAVNVGATREECEAILTLNRAVFGLSTSDEAFDTLQRVFG